LSQGDVRRRLGAFDVLWHFILYHTEWCRDPRTAPSGDHYGAGPFSIEIQQGPPAGVLYWKSANRARNVISKSEATKQSLGQFKEIVPAPKCRSKK